MLYIALGTKHVTVPEDGNEQVVIAVAADHNVYSRELNYEFIVVIKF